MQNKTMQNKNKTNKAIAKQQQTNKQTNKSSFPELPRLQTIDEWYACMIDDYIHSFDLW